MWGFITVLVDSLIPRLKEIFEINNTQAVLVQFAFFGAYGLLSIPAGNLLHKIGYKKGIMLGLGIMGFGALLFLPAASFRVFALFMLGYFILAAGMVILQVAANPYVAALGDERTASSRLNLAQAFNSLGTTIAPILGAVFILSDDIKSSEEIKAFYSSFDTDLPLNNLYTNKAFIIDKEGKLRGRTDDKDSANGKLYGYNMQSVAELNNKMKDDVKVVLAEYRLALKKNNADREI